MQYPLWFTPFIIGMPCITILTVALVWWHLSRLITKLVLESSSRFDKLFSDQTARTQVLLAQNAAILRKLEE